MGVVGPSSLSLPGLEFCPKYPHGLNNDTIPLFPPFSTASPGLGGSSAATDRAQPAQVALELNQEKPHPTIPWKIPWKSRGGT